MKNLPGPFFMLLGLGLLLTATPASFAGDGQQQKGGEGANYTVRKGDTLWDISGAHLKNPYIWQNIWKLNPGIKDPNLIFPGNRITIPGLDAGEQVKAPEPSEEKAAGTGEAPEETTGRARSRETNEGPFVDKGKTILKLDEKGNNIINLDKNTGPTTPIATISEIEAAGYIARDLGGAKAITGNPLDGRDVFSSGDDLYVSSGRKGSLFLIVTPKDSVDDPGTGKDLGKLLYVKGVLRVTDIRDGKHLGVIETSFAAVTQEDMLLPYTEPQLVYERPAASSALKGKFGYVSEVKDSKDTGATGDIIYLDMGASQGVRPGDIFILRRSGDGKSHLDGHHFAGPGDYELPDIEVGTAQVISVQPDSSTAKVLTSKEIVSIGYRAVYKD